MLTDPIFLAVTAVAVILLGLAKGGFAGVGTLSTPLLALVIAPGDAAGILLPILLVSDVISVWSYRKTWDARNLKVMMPAAAMGIAVGWWLAAYFTPAYIRLSIGAIAIAFGLFNLVGLAGRRKIENPSAVKGAFWAAVAGFTSFVSHAGGLPFQIHLLPQKLPHQVFVGTSTILLRLDQLPQGRALRAARPAFGEEHHGVARLPAVVGGGDLRRRVAHPPHAARALLQDHLCAHAGGGGRARTRGLDGDFRRRRRALKSRRGFATVSFKE
ncbi:MAG TPA: sulfite exporter TauE/SafE family protein [Xanthobacteraceae bacterium]|nr:sulfite exporter TauE/SafE family protein [Xanthobacteraceae bacterium]